MIPLILQRRRRHPTSPPPQVSPLTRVALERSVLRAVGEIGEPLLPRIVPAFVELCGGVLKSTGERLAFMTTPSYQRLDLRSKQFNRLMYLQPAFYPSLTFAGIQLRNKPVLSSTTRAQRGPWSLGLSLGWNQTFRSVVVHDRITKRWVKILIISGRYSGLNLLLLEAMSLLLPSSLLIARVRKCSLAQIPIGWWLLPNASNAVLKGEREVDKAFMRHVKRLVRAWMAASHILSMIRHNTRDCSRSCLRPSAPVFRPSGSFGLAIAEEVPTPPLTPEKSASQTADEPRSPLSKIENVAPKKRNKSIRQRLREKIRQVERNEKRNEKRRLSRNKDIDDAIERILMQYEGDKTA